MYYHLIKLYSASIPRYTGVILVLLVFTGYGCKKDKETDFQPGTNEFVNKWILDSMKVYYYWNKNLPGNPDYFQEPLDFFSSIKNSADRFSELVNPVIPSTYQQTMSNNFGIDLLAVENSGETELYVSLVVPGSFAARSGLVRGQRVLTVNGTIPDAGNVAGILQNCLDIKTAELMIEGLPSAVKLTPASINEDPIHLYKLIGNGKKTGCLFLNRFVASNASSLCNVTGYFKNAGVTSLIIDLRYNPGGDVSMAALLAALVAPVGGSDIFAEYRGNNNAGTKRNSFDKELSYINRAVGQLDAFRLNLNKVYILTGHHTVSSAELLINSLRPYADEEARSNFEVNVFGCLNVIRNVMPQLRNQGSGHIFNVSSVGGFFAGFQGWGVYCATKFAVAGFTESLAEEVKEFGIKATVVYPGYFRTDFLSQGSIKVAQKPIEAYAAARESEQMHLNNINGNQSNDPEKAADVLISVTKEENPPVHLFIGNDAYDMVYNKINIITNEAERWKSYTLSTAI